MYDNVLIATDGSDGAESGVSYGLDLAETMDARVHALYVVETKATYILTVGLTDDDLEAYREYGEETVTAVVERAATRNIDGKGAIRTGRPAEEIVDYVGENDVDAIVIGKQGHGAIDRHIGSTPEKVVRMANVPVTVVSRD